MAHIEAEEHLTKIMEFTLHSENVFNYGNEDGVTATKEEKIKNLKREMKVRVDVLIRSFGATQNTINPEDATGEILEDSLIFVEIDGVTYHFFPNFEELENGEIEQTFFIMSEKDGKTDLVLEGMDSIYEKIDKSTFPIPGHGDMNMEDAMGKDNIGYNNPNITSDSTLAQRLNMKKDNVKKQLNKNIHTNEVEGLVKSFIGCSKSNQGYKEMITYNPVFSEIFKFNKQYRSSNERYYNQENTLLLKLLIDNFPELKEVNVLEDGSMSEEDSEKVENLLNTHGKIVDNKKIDLSSAIINTAEGIQEYYRTTVINNTEVEETMLAEVEENDISSEFYKFMQNSIALEEVLGRDKIKKEDKVDKFNEYIEALLEMDVKKLSDEEKNIVKETKEKLGLGENEEYNSKKPPVTIDNISDYEKSIFRNNNIIKDILRLYPEDTDILKAKANKMQDDQILRDFAEIFGENKNDMVDGNNSVALAKLLLFGIKDIPGGAMSFIENALNGVLPKSLQLEDKYIHTPEKMASLITKNLKTLTENKTASNVAYALDYIGVPGNGPMDKSKLYTEGIGGTKGKIIDAFSKKTGLITSLKKKRITPPHSEGTTASQFDKLYIDNMYTLQNATNSGMNMKVSHLLAQNVTVGYEGTDSAAYTYLKHYEGMKRSMGFEHLQPSRMNLKTIQEKVKSKVELTDGEKKFLYELDPLSFEQYKPKEIGPQSDEIEYSEMSINFMSSRHASKGDTHNFGSSDGEKEKRNFFSKYSSKFKGKEDIIFTELNMLKAEIKDLKIAMDPEKEQENNEVMSDDIGMEEEEHTITDDIGMEEENIEISAEDIDIEEEENIEISAEDIDIEEENIEISAEDIDIEEENIEISAEDVGIDTDNPNEEKKALPYIKTETNPKELVGDALELENKRAKKAEEDKNKGNQK